MGRRFLLLLLALLLILTLGACGKKEDAGDIPEESASGEENSVQEESGAEESQSSEPEPEESLPKVHLYDPSACWHGPGLSLLGDGNHR